MLKTLIVEDENQEEATDDIYLEKLDAEVMLPPYIAIRH